MLWKSLPFLGALIFQLQVAISFGIAQEERPCMEGQFRTECAHGNTDMPAVEARPRPDRLQKWPASSKSRYPSICRRPGCSRPSHCGPSISAAETRRLGRAGGLPASRFLQQLFHWAPSLGSKSIDAIITPFDKEEASLVMGERRSQLVVLPPTKRSFSANLDMQPALSINPCGRIK
jgi:hypothetical protein